ncbi:MAG: glycerol dehydrogenase [Verrucomicrobia bacterium]|nr:glycerol dehydrogenase [Verrucomicrobiota bacterium]
MQVTHFTFIAPRKYMQGRNLLSEAGTHISQVGKKPLLLWDARVKRLLGERVLASLKAAALEAIDVEFRGDSTKAEAARVAQIARDKGADVIVGLGGGKTLDTAKAAAAAAGKKMVSCPTVASTDSPTSSFTVWYDEKGVCQGFESWGVNPDLVLVDSQVIAEAPVRAFVAGMGDALSTWVEAEVVYSTRGQNLVGGRSTLVAMAIARLGYDTLMKYGLEAKRAVEQKVVTHAVEKVIEANTLMSGLGFESCGVATAHMIANCLPGFPECKGLMHGEEVAFGIISQFCLDENMATDEMHKMVDFMIAVGLPVTFSELGLAGVTRDRLQKIGDVCASPGSLCHAHPFKVTSETVVNAMIAADALGQERKKLLKR